MFRSLCSACHLARVWYHQSSNDCQSVRRRSLLLCRFVFLLWWEGPQTGSCYASSGWQETGDPFAFTQAWASPQPILALRSSLLHCWHWKPLRSSCDHPQSLSVRYSLVPFVFFSTSYYTLQIFKNLLRKVPSITISSLYIIDFWEFISSFFFKYFPLQRPISSLRSSSHPYNPDWIIHLFFKLVFVEASKEKSNRMD